MQLFKVVDSRCSSAIFASILACQARPARLHCALVGAWPGGSSARQLAADCLLDPVRARWR
jgi:hypothetical protein